MRKLLKRIAICSFIAILCWSACLISDRQKLNQSLIRFHVVANSDSAEDQSIKLKVRDVILGSIQTDLRQISDVNDAREYLRENLPKLQNLVEETLDQLGFEGTSSITLCKEAFDLRHYDTFMLPAGIYDSLRIVIGNGEGKNWWCVSFPTLCIPATSSGFSAAAVSAGFSEPLAQTLAGKEDYKIRFYFLNQLGKLENIFFQE